MNHQLASYVAVSISRYCLPLQLKHFTRRLQLHYHVLGQKVRCSVWLIISPFEMISGTSAILIDTFPLHKLSDSNCVFRGEGRGGEEIEQKGLGWADFRKCIESTAVCVETIWRCDAACWASCASVLTSLFCSFEKWKSFSVWKVRGYFSPLSKKDKVSELLIWCKINPV